VLDALSIDNADLVTHDIGNIMSPVSAKPCSSTTAGPCPPTRVWIVAPMVSTSWVRKPAGKGCTLASAGRETIAAASMYAAQ